MINRTNEKDDYYKILGVDRKATDAEIKQAYRRLALQYRKRFFSVLIQLGRNNLDPDKNPDPDATAKFQEIAKAYKVLGDSKSRSTYDFLGAHGENFPMIIIDDSV